MARLIFLLSGLALLICSTILARWDIGGGIRFDRTAQDLRELSPVDLRELSAIDPWGSHYRVAGSAPDEHVFSCGPDRQSASQGHDADDIAPWTHRSDWLAALYPVGPTKVLLGLSIVGLLSSAPRIVSRSRRARGNRMRDRTSPGVPRPPL